MSLVGNISFGNFDRTAQTSGIGLHRATSYRVDDDPQAVPMQDNPVQRNTSMLRRVSTSISRTISGGNTIPEGDEYPPAGSGQYGEGYGEARVVELARALSRQTSTHQSTHQTGEGASDDGGEDFLIVKDSEYDPFSSNFDSKKWIRRMVGVVSKDELHPMRTSGIAYSNLRVFGYGGGADYQETVGNKPLSILSDIAGLVSRNKSKVNILKGFDGLLEAGELLVVLGPRKFHRSAPLHICLIIRG